jgi:hypothetical protein
MVAAADVYNFSFIAWMIIGMVQEEEHTKIWNVLRKHGFWPAKHHVSLFNVMEIMWKNKM